MKQAVLFKSPQVTVHNTAGFGDGTSSPAKAVLTTSKVTIPLDAAATEVLVGYLRILRSYFTAAHRSKHLLSSQLDQVAVYLETSLQNRGSSLIEYHDVTYLIQQMGCLHVWATLPAEYQNS
ncbi:hypothetical protein [Rufibacter tibetensis]|uniref:Uncharacterized protein n=1 Tax=Rufibacter tibetensis TaxID=512763 RepID=A0A0P0CTT3_9BACT|nr:hypothetical protein [Rufibacter tibetensis]ALI97702.1 hypothetical protein DC20_00215 [Rufibacter tibetensis]